MSLIAMQSPETATGEVARIYSEMQQMMGSVPNAMRIFSLNPLWLRQQWDYIGYYMNHPNLSFPLLAVVRMQAGYSTDPPTAASPVQGPP